MANQAVAQQCAQSSGETTTFRMVTMNVDGLREKGVSPAHLSCIAAMATAILATNADVVCLQEVTPQNIHPFNDRLCNFEFQLPRLVPVGASYFTVTYIAKRHRIANARRMAYCDVATSGMGRDMLITTINLGGHCLNIFNTHLESGKAEALLRVRQLQQALQVAGRQPGISILCGDMNLRLPEWKEISKSAPHVIDLFDSADVKNNNKVNKNNGSNKPLIPEYTWKRLMECGAPFAAQARFDRVLYSSPDLFVNADSYSLIGTETVSVGKGVAAWGDDLGWWVSYFTPSDHLGIKATLRIAADPSGPVSAPPPSPATAAAFC